MCTPRTSKANRGVVIWKGSPSLLRLRTSKLQEAWLQALKHAMQQGGLEPLLRLGLPRERAQLLATVRPDHLRALHQLEVEVGELLQAAAKVSGCTVPPHYCCPATHSEGAGAAACCS